MERDVNLKLLYIILILLLALGGTTIFYQMKYEKLKTDYDKSLSTFNYTLKNLSNIQKEPIGNLSDNVSINREYVLASKLENKTKELESLSRELASVQQQLFEYQQKYDSLNVNYTITNELSNKRTESIGRFQEKLDTLRSDVVNGASKNIILQDIDQLQDELSRLRSY